MAATTDELTTLKESLRKLGAYCSREGYKGWDPYDGLNSRFFQSVPFLKRSSLARLAWIQLFKRSPVNLRRLLLVPRGYNPKGIALILSGYCNILKYQRMTGSAEFGSEEVLLKKIDFLGDLLLSLRSSLYGSESASCWGYNFDWQARRLFLFPKYTPTVVVTSFCASALIDAYRTTGAERYLQAVLSSADFVMNDLHRTPRTEGFLFSYSHLQGNDTVYNASLLGTKLLCLCYQYTKKKEHLAAARASAAACVSAQNSDGSWFYGELPVQGWIDSFHTGYNLEALETYREITGDNSFDDAVVKGFGFYIRKFFLADGTPKYYHNKTYPVDIHCPAQLLVTLCRSGKLDEYRYLANKVLSWTISNMQDKRGYFYYQKSRLFTNRISYMRWSNAFMFNALTHYLVNVERS